MTHGNSRPTGFEQFVNGVVGGSVKLGWAPKHTRSLFVRGRGSGRWCSAPVNALELDGSRNLRAGDRPVSELS
jgi:hypothetical protein